MGSFISTIKNLIKKSKMPKLESHNITDLLIPWDAYYKIYLVERAFQLQFDYGHRIVIKP